jgi:hypothetical protein
VLSTARRLTYEIEHAGKETSSSLIVALAGASRSARLMVVSGTGDVMLLEAPPVANRLTSTSLSSPKRSSHPIDTSSTIYPVLSAGGEFGAVATRDWVEIFSLVAPHGPIATVRARAEITALACLDNGACLVGFTDGSLELVSPSGDPQHSAATEPIRRQLHLPSGVRGPIVLISVDPAKVTPDSESSESPPPVIAAIVTRQGELHKLRLDFAQTKSPVSLVRTTRLGWLPTLLELFAGGEVAAVAHPGRFDIISLDFACSALERENYDAKAPIKTSDVIAVSDEARRVATLSLYEQGRRLEIEALDWHAAGMASVDDPEPERALA